MTDTPKAAPVECAYCHLPHMSPCSSTEARDGCAIFKAQTELAAHIMAAQQQETMTQDNAFTVAPSEPVQPAPAPAAPAVAPAVETAATDNLTGAVKADAGKPRWELLPSDATEEMLKVLDFGAQKYGEWNWTGGMKWSRLFSATLRHMWAFQRGQDNDPESGLSHLAHAACNVLFMLSYAMWKRGQDDRPAAIGAGR